MGCALGPCPEQLALFEDLGRDLKAAVDGSGAAGASVGWLQCRHVSREVLRAALFVGAELEVAVEDDAEELLVEIEPVTAKHRPAADGQRAQLVKHQVAECVVRHRPQFTAHGQGCWRAPYWRAASVAAYIRKTPQSVFGMGALSAAEMPIERTRRVSSGSITPSSQSRAVLK